MKLKYTYKECPVAWPEDTTLRPIQEVTMTVTGWEYAILLDALMDYTLNKSHDDYSRSEAMGMFTQMRLEREEL